MEEWKQIPGFDYYFVSNMGNVKSTRYGRERIMKPFRAGKYLGVWLGAKNKHYIHRIVASVWLEPIDGFQVDHINKRKEDNRAINLRWVSASDNMKNRHPYVRDGHIKEKNGKKFFCKAHIVNSHAL